MGSAAGRAILIAGPTASGKSAIALELAEKLDGAIINADSMQVYADLSILTARPTQDELQRVPHHLFGHVDAAETYSVGRWLRDVERVLSQVRSRGEMPILVGGTGLYFKALTEGLSDIPTIPDSVRARLREGAFGVPSEDLHARLAALDPIMAARLRPSDPQRVLRALEVIEATGQSLSTFHSKRERPTFDGLASLGVVVTLERPQLRARIDQRFDAMMEQGALDEVRRLASRGMDPALPAMRALGVSALLNVLAGACDLTTAVSEAKTASRQYAKRQITFARHQLPTFRPVDPSEAVRDIVANL